jgi:hypothetical protein
VVGLNFLGTDSRQAHAQLDSPIPVSYLSSIRWAAQNTPPEISYRSMVAILEMAAGVIMTPTATRPSKNHLADVNRAVRKLRRSRCTLAIKVICHPPSTCSSAETVDRRAKTRTLSFESPMKSRGRRLK